MTVPGSAGGTNASDAPVVARAGDAAPPLVSIIVPVLDGEAYLRESLDSILGQVYPSIELIVMDDGSTDGTEAIVATYGDRVRYVRQPATRGIYGNANDGIALARGEFIGVFHADDVYLPEMVEREVSWLLSHPSAGAVFCSDVFIDPDGNELGRLNPPPELAGGKPLDYEQVLNGLLRYKNAFLRCPTALVRASVYAALGGYRDETFKNTSDLEMWLRIARSFELGVLDDHLLLYRRGHGSSSERYHRVRTDPERFFRILDLELEAGGRSVADADALRAYEAHRAHDTLLRAVNHYILAERQQARDVMDGLRLRSLAASGQVQRIHLVPLAIAMWCLVRVPRLSVVARFFDRHRHGAAARPTLARPG
jgi:glycosyltransferase involved in cell wall biosynthesis